MKIPYELKIYSKYSLLDMSFDIKVKGHIQYYGRDYSIFVMKTHNGPVLQFAYYESNLSDKVKELLNKISPEIISVLDNLLRESQNNLEREYLGEVHVEKYSDS